MNSLPKVVAHQHEDRKWSASCWRWSLVIVNHTNDNVDNIFKVILINLTHTIT